MTLSQYAARLLNKHHVLHGYFCLDPHGARQLLSLYKWISERSK